MSGLLSYEGYTLVGRISSPNGAAPVTSTHHAELSYTSVATTHFSLAESTTESSLPGHSTPIGQETPRRHRCQVTVHSPLAESTMESSLPGQETVRPNLILKMLIC